MTEGRRMISGLNPDAWEIPAGPPHPCPYLPGRMAREQGFMADRLPFGLYRQMMDRGWRRSGQILYKPACQECQACETIRIPVRDFAPNRTQRKLLRRLSGVRGRLRSAKPTDEKFDLFVRYQKARHRGDMCTTWNEYESFLYSSPVETREMEFWEEDRLVAVAILDFDFECVSSVYTYFEPGHASGSLGTYAILYLIGYIRRLGFPYYYLGYLIEDCRKMSYKINFRPCEVTSHDGRWRRIEKHSNEPNGH